MIREAKKSDIPNMLELAEMFHNEADTECMPKFNADASIASARSLIESDNAILLVNEVDGIIVGIGSLVIVPISIFSIETIAQELFWYVVPEHRGVSGIRMHKEMENFAIDKGAKLISMVDVKSSMDLEDYYLRNGYTLFERTYVKRI